MRYAERLFDAFMYPFEAVALRQRRRELMPLAAGHVLEIGVGTGSNLPYYDLARITDLHLLDLSLTDTVKEFRAGDGTKVHFHEGRAEALPFDDHQFDVVVFTLVFCSVGDADQGVSEVRRVLKDDGIVVFVEHVRPQPAVLSRAAHAVNPAWHSLTGECNLDRDTVATIQRGGFQTQWLRSWAKGFLVDGVALPITVQENIEQRSAEFH